MYDISSRVLLPLRIPCRSCEDKHSRVFRKPTACIHAPGDLESFSKQPVPYVRQIVYSIHTYRENNMIRISRRPKAPKKTKAPHERRPASISTFFGVLPIVVVPFSTGRLRVYPTFVGMYIYIIAVLRYEKICQKNVSVVVACDAKKSIIVYNVYIYFTGGLNRTRDKNPRRGPDEGQLCA